MERKLKRKLSSRLTSFLLSSAYQWPSYSFSFLLTDGHWQMNNKKRIVKERQLSPAQSSILFILKMKKKMTVNRWLSFSLAITKKKRKSYVTELESSFGHTFSLFCLRSPRTSLWSRPTCKEKRNSWPGFSWHNDSECYRQEKIKEKVGQAVSVSRAYCGPHQEREKNGPQ